MNAREKTGCVVRTVCVLSAFLFCAASSAMTLPDQEWERIDLDDDHTSIESSDKSRRNAAIPTETAGDLEVPEVLRGFQVVSIGKQAFYGCTQLTSVTIPEGVTNIADQAFYNCSSLTNVVFPSTLKSIGASAFIGCQKLASINIEAPRLTIGDRAFRNCDGLQAIRFVGDELNASTRAFFGCGGLRDVSLIVKDITLSEGAFSGGYDPWPTNHCGYCDRLTNVIVAASNRVDLGVSVFAGCSALQQVMLTAGAEMSIGSTAFSGCTALRQATLTAGAGIKVGASSFSSCRYNYSDYSSCNHLTNVLMVASNRVELGSSAFSSCTALQGVALPEGLVGVPTNAFYCCYSLQSISLSSNVTSIAYRAFDTCTSLRSVELAEGLQTIDAQAFYGCSALEDLRVPQSVSQIGDRAFERCDELGRLVFCEGDTNTPVAAAVSVGERAFYRNGSLTNVVLSQAVSKLGARAFAECGSLTTVNLPTNLVEVSESLFELCEKLEKVDFSPKLTAIGSSAFNACSSLATFSIPTQNVVSVGSKSFYKTKYWNDWPDDSIVVNNGYILGFKGSTTSVVLPDDCRAIPNGMFEGMTALTNVTVPAVLEKIGSRAFYGSGIISIDLSGTKVSTIGASAFADCPALLSAVLPSALMAIPDDAFRNCSTLVSIDIPAKVASIGASAFRDCVSLMTVSDGTGVRSVGDYAFAGCVKLQPFRFGENVAYGEHVFQYVEWTENVLLPSVGTMEQEYPQTYADIKSIVISSTLTGVVDRACAGCVALESVVIPDGVKSIGSRAFEGCTAMTSLALSPSVTSVGSNVVDGCTALVTLTTSGAIVFKTAFPELAERISDIRIADGVVSLCDNALAGCTKMTKIEIPWTVETIGASAFANCVSISEDIWIPDLVTSIGDLAFANCTKLRKVRYLGDCPVVGSDIYRGTSKALSSWVLRDTLGWEEAGTTGDSGSDDEEDVVDEDEPLFDDIDDEDEPEDGSDEKESDVGGGLSIGSGNVRWPDDDNARPLRYMGLANVDRVSFVYYNGTTDRLNRHFKFGCGAVIEDFPDQPERDGYEPLGWFTAPYGGAKVEPPLIVTGSMNIYAHWMRVGSEDDPREYPTSWGDVTYDVKRSHVYDGYLLDGDKVAGTIQVKLTKGKYNKNTEEMTVTATAKAFILGEGKNISFKGVAEDVGEDGGSADLVCTKKSDERELSVNFRATDMDGSLDGYNVVAARNMFAYSTDWERRAALAAVDDCGGTYAVILRADGDDPLSDGYAALSVNVGSKGKAKVSGTMPDGTKVSVSSQLLILPDTDEYVVPVVVPLYSGKKGGFGFGLQFLRDEEFGVVSNMTVFGATEWTANPGKANEFTSTLTEVGVGAAGNLAGTSVFSMEDSFDIDDVMIDDSLLPVDVEVAVSGKKWVLPKADKVKFDRESESYDVTTEYGNSAGLKLTYTAKTGMFKGSFKVYAVTDAGKSKKYTATVNGAVVDGVGYGTAFIKKVGAAAIVITPNE